MFTKANCEFENSTSPIRVASIEQVDKITVGQIELSFLNRSVSFAKQLIPTTGLEFNLLAVLIENAGALVSREVIAQRIFHCELHHCDKCINSHMANLRKKFLAVYSQAMIKTVRGQGYIFIR